MAGTLSWLQKLTIFAQATHVAVTHQVCNARKSQVWHE